jgi:ABC-type uncharacterized transport system permease subunit
LTIFFNFILLTLFNFILTTFSLRFNLATTEKGNNQNRSAVHHRAAYLRRHAFKKLVQVVRLAFGKKQAKIQISGLLARTFDLVF